MTEPGFAPGVEPGVEPEVAPGAAADAAPGAPAVRPGVRLGVDVGSVRVGVAVCDPEGILATPLTTVPAGEGAPDPVAAVAALAAEHAAMEVVVGLPRSLSGEEGPAAAKARTFARALAKALGAAPGDGPPAGPARPAAVRLVDERLTTVDAHRALRESGRTARTSRQVIDQAAAVLILDAALTAERLGGRPAGELVTGRKPRRRG